MSEQRAVLFHPAIGEVTVTLEESPVEDGTYEILISETEVAEGVKVVLLENTGNTFTISEQIKCDECKARWGRHRITCSKLGGYNNLTG